ncbi:O-antigen ligase family protein [Rhodoferax sp.]|uniref:O-antigen ligase family protein n=1 Tax=Rhodoferax sp. TaxID=50421 RepID=UPI0039B8D785
MQELDGAHRSVLPWRRDPAAWVVGLLALTLFLAPAVGATSERLLQDTLKSMIVAFGCLLAALLLCWSTTRNQATPRWHALLWLPIGLMVYAAGSMVWSHTYLAAVEAARWFVLSLLLWVGLSSLKREHLPILLTGIHWGAVMASLWAALQFWFDLKLFPQGPSPASTFINRNFFAEYVVCTLPFSAWLITQGKGLGQVTLRVGTTAFTLVAILMTGTRSALLALLMLLVLLPWALYRYRQSLGWTQWSRLTRLAALGTLLLTVGGLGLIDSGNPKVLAEQHGSAPLDRAFSRALSMTESSEYSAGSFSIRAAMWKATLRMIAANPVVGVGAGAWEVEIPRYQVAGAQVEDDYYAHNEILQLLAEYGLAGWAFLLALLAYLSWVAWTLREGAAGSDQAEAPMRALSLCSLLALLMVSNAGFPWRMASSGALFVLSLAILAASDARMRERPRRLVVPHPWSAASARTLMVVMVVSMAVATFLSVQAVQAERRLVRAAQLALSITRSGAPNDPRWAATKEDILSLVDQGIAINPHYRKITPIVADELARWGDWENAVWIWESVVASRPYVVAMLTNIGSGYAYMGHLDKALEYLNRAQAIQPQSLAARSLEALLLIRSGRDAEATTLIQSALLLDRYDVDLLNAAYALGVRTSNWSMAIEALQRRTKRWPEHALDGWLKLGHLYAGAGVNDPTKALDAYQRAVALAPPQLKQQVRDLVAPVYRDRL